MDSSEKDGHPKDDPNSTHDEKLFGRFNFQVDPSFFTAILPELVRLKKMTVGERAAIEKVLEMFGPNAAANVFCAVLKANLETSSEKTFLKSEKPEEENQLREKFLAAQSEAEGGPLNTAVKVHSAIVGARVFFKLALEVAESGDEALKQEILSYLDTREQQIAGQIYPIGRRK